jgi:hypothetical protein
MYSGNQNEGGHARRGSPGSESESMRLQPSLPSIRHLGFPLAAPSSSVDSNTASNRALIADDPRHIHDFPIGRSEETHPPSQGHPHEPPKKKRRRQALSCTGTYLLQY